MISPSILYLHYKKYKIERKMIQNMLYYIHITFEEWINYLMNN